MNSKHFLLIAATAAFVFASAGLTLGQESPATRPTIRVSAEATVTARPDEAEINLGVLTQADTAEAAATQNAQKQDNVISELRKLLGAKADIRTIGYSVSPNYRYPKEGGQPTISGYTATNIVQVKTASLDQVGKLIDLATRAGANTIQALRFTLKDDATARAQALREASIKAKAKADAIASALGVKIQRILRVEEGGGLPRPAYDVEAGTLGGLRAQAAPTPVEAGTIEIRAVIALTVEVSQ